MKNTTPQPLRVALVYDRVNTFGGAERVLRNLHELYPHAPLYTSVYDLAGAAWTKGWDVRPSFLQRVPFVRTRHQWLALFMPLAFESFDFSAFDLVISVSSEAAKGIITKPGTRHVCYLLTPTRYVWSHVHQYERDYFPGVLKIFLPVYRFFLRYLRAWDSIAAQRPDLIIPISQTVKQRVEKYYKRKTANVIYPPVATHLFESRTISSTSPFPWKQWYLCVSRLVPYKRIDTAIRACMLMKRHLVIVGKGNDEQRLRKIAGGSDYIHFVGYLTDDELVGYYQHCSALLLPGEEDFGIVAVEAMAAGIPVATYVKSGNAEVVIPGKTGVHIQTQTTQGVQEAIQMLEKTQFTKQVIREYAKQYSEAVFKRAWEEQI